MTSDKLKAKSFLKTHKINSWIKKYDMKQIIILILLLSETFILNAQYQFRVSESDFQFSKASHHGFSVHIYESNIHDIEKSWKK